MARAESLTNLPERNLGRFEIIPRFAVDEIVINQQMVDGVNDEKLRRFLDKDYIVENCAVFAFGNDRGRRTKLQPPSMTRGVVFRYGTFTDENGICYGQVAAKGTGLTPTGVGQRYRTIGPYVPNRMDPHGMFGNTDSLQEGKISDEFAALHGRNGRIIATIILEPNVFKKWLEGREEENYKASEIASRVENNGHVPAIAVRLLGADRYQDMLLISKESPKKQTYNQFSVLKRAANLLRTEMEQRGDKEFSDFYKIDQVRRYREALENISKGNLYDMPKSDMYEMIELLAHFTGFNAGILRKLSEEKYNFSLQIPDVSFQNFDIAGFWYDWEQSLELKDQSRDGMKDKIEMRLIKGKSFNIFPGSLSALVIGRLVALTEIRDPIVREHFLDKIKNGFKQSSGEELD